MLTVLLRFEDNDNLNFEEIAACIHLPEQELLQHLQTLVDAKLLLLDYSGEVHQKSALIINIMFTNKQKSFRVISAPRKKADASFAEQYAEK